MKKILFLTLAALAVTFAKAQEGEFKSFMGEEIKGLICDGPLNIQLAEDPNNTGIISNVEDVSITKNNDGYIRIKAGNDLTKSFMAKITIKVTVSKLEYLRLTGKCAVIAKGKFMRSDEVTISMEGSSASAEYLDIVAKDVKIDLAGLTKLEEFTVDTKSLKVTASSTGPKIVINGKADKCNMTVTGTHPQISMVNCPVNELDANVGGMATVKVNVTGKGYVKVGSTATFRYIGSGVIEGEGTFKPL